MKSKTNALDLSVIITSHSEGIFAHKTILSLERALSPIKDSGVSYEIVVNLDNPSDETVSYFSQFKDNSHFNILKPTNFRNPSDSRNHAIKQACGRYVTFIDADDLVSENWLIDSYNMMKKQTKPTILHANSHIQFGIDEPVVSIWLTHNSEGKKKDALSMIQFNKWPMLIFSERRLLLKHPYPRSVNGFGYEDFALNCDSVAKGVKNIIVPETIMFYRRTSTSMQASHISAHTVLPYTELFDTKFLKSLPIQETITRKPSYVKRVVKKILSLGRRAAVKIPAVERKITSVANERSFKSNSELIPEWMMKEWRAINQIDNSLYPTKDIITHACFHPLSFDSQNDRLGQVYRRLIDSISKNPDYVFYTYDPLGAGGTEKVLMHYIYALNSINPNWRFLILRKRPEIFPFDIPSNVDFMDFDGLTEGLEYWEKEILFDRLIAQLKFKRIHAFFNGYSNGDFLFNWIRNHKEFLAKNNFIFNVSWFMQEYVEQDEPNRVLSFADPCLLEIHDVVDKVFTDNETIIIDSLKNNAFSKQLFSVHYQPMSYDKLIPPKTIDPNKPLRILWASRLSLQKRPDILKAIGKKLDPTKFQIDAYGREQHFEGKYLNNIESINYKGSYNGIENIDLSQYDAFLYTSQTDGIPNVLLEISIAGLPIVASNAGGVKEVIIDKKTGLLSDVEKIDEYVQKLEYIKTNPKKAAQMVLRCQELVQERFNWQNFIKDVKRDIK